MQVQYSNNFFPNCVAEPMCTVVYRALIVRKQICVEISMHPSPITEEIEFTLRLLRRIDFSFRYQDQSATCYSINEVLMSFTPYKACHATLPTYPRTGEIVSVIELLYLYRYNSILSPAKKNDLIVGLPLWNP